MRTPSVLFAACGLALAVLAAPASAAADDRSSADRPHCVLTAQDVNADTVATPVRCHRTFAEANADANGAGTVLGIGYDRKVFAGWSYVIVADESDACTDGKSFGIPRLPARYNNMISSARTYNGCAGVHFDRANYRGDHVSCGCSTMPGMSNRTTSILFEPTQ